MPSISSLPAAEEHVALYIISIAKDSKSSSKIQSVTHAISWAHQLAGFKDILRLVHMYVVFLLLHRTFNH